MSSSIDKMQAALGTLASAVSLVEEADTSLQYATQGSAQPEFDEAHASYQEALGKISDSRGLINSAHDSVQETLGRIGGNAVEVAAGTSAGSAACSPANGTEANSAVDSPQPPPVRTRDAADASAGQEVNAETASAVQLVDGKAVADTLGITIANIKNIVSELLMLDYATEHQQYPQEYIEALKESREWNERPEFRGLKAGARSFAQTDAARELVDQTIQRFEGRIDEILRATGNAALSNEQVAEILQVGVSTVANWRWNGPLNNPAILHGEKHGIPPHLLFSLYNWKSPAAQTAADSGESQAVAGGLLSNEEVAARLSMSVSGLTKTAAHLHAINLATNAKRFFPAHYINALLASPQMAANNSPTAAAREFSHQPEAARAMARAVADQDKRLTTAATSSGTIPVYDTLGSMFNIAGRTVRLWQSTERIETVDREHHREKLAVTRSDFEKLYRWKYPQEYPQNR